MQIRHCQAGKERKKMAKIGTKKLKKGTFAAQKTKKVTENTKKAAECVRCLLDLHGLQGVLLKQLDKEIS
jgi:hypothetical protein